MAGIQIKVDEQSLKEINSKLERLIQLNTDLSPVMAQIGESLLRSTRQRFRTQQSPSGTSWDALAPSTLKSKHRNTNKVLTLRGYLQGQLRWDADSHSVVIGTDTPYAAIHQLGGSINKPAGQRDVYFKQNADGSIGNHFVKKKNSNFAQAVNVGAHTINIPARPFLGVSQSDEQTIVDIINSHIRKVLS